MDRRLLCLETKNTKLTPLVRNDVEFVFDLRISNRTQYMNQISHNIDDQYAYFDEYVHRFNNGTEIYYKIDDKSTSEKVGVVRLTEIDNTETFCWESMVTILGTKAVVSVDTFCLIYIAGFNLLERNRCSPFKVPKANKRVIELHEIMGIADRVGETGEHWLYHVTRAKFTDGIKRMQRMGFGVTDV